MRRPIAGTRSALLSIAAHGTAICAVLLLTRVHGPVLAPQHLAGTVHGAAILPAFQLAGSPPGVASARAAAHARTPAPPQRHRSSALKAAQLSTPAVDSVTRNAGEGSEGDGDISIALVQFHPRPQPDLSSLPAGAAGDVVLNALIDAQGRVAQLTVSKSLGQAVDSQVIATVQQWTFTPAKRNGTPIASEQEILFHYERSHTG